MGLPAASVVATCSACGEPLNTKGECLACLLRAALDKSVVESAAPGSVVFGDFEIARSNDGSPWELGRGAMGVTYLAMDRVLRRKVALKVIEVPATMRGLHELHQRFLREARSAASLRHPNVAAVYQFGGSPDGRHRYYAMELVEGETLETRVRRDGPLNSRLVLEIAIQITRALMAAAAHGLIHRDLKPGNIMLARSDMADLEAKVIDFGLAKVISESENEMDLTHGGFVGTPNFASPEQFRTGPVDVRSDIYSLGATLWFALTGKTPFPGRNVEEIHRAQQSNPLPIEQLKAARVPSRFRLLLRSMLAIEPALRPGLQKLASQLRRCSAQLNGVRRISLALAAATILVLGVSAFLLLRSLRIQNSASNPGTLEKSIAVLPFDNLSRDPDNAYFAEAIQEEILTDLAKVAALKVISRTSTQLYQSKPRNLTQIAKQLGVANILEGSVQKVADHVRVNVQLLNAQTDSHLWAETYDRQLTDIFGVESEIAKGIAESLQARLTSREERALAVKPTNNPEAYDAYLRGLAFEARSSYSIDNLMKAIGFYERTVELDPNFALGWARLSRADASLYFTGADTTAPRRDAAKNALENAQNLQPNSPETMLALGYYQYWVLHDYGLAKTTFERVQKMLPGSSDVLSALGGVARREGHWDQSVAYWKQALILDPRNVELLNETALTYVMLRQFPTALKLYDRALDIVPNNPDLMASKAGIYQAEGNLEQAAKFLPEVNGETPYGNAFVTKFTQLRLERNLGEAIRLLQARQAQLSSEIERGINQVTLAIVQRLAGDAAGAKTNAEQARNALEPLCKNQPDNYMFAAMLSLANAALGEKDSALKEGERAIALLPSTKDRMFGPGFEENLALIQTMFGANSQAISTLARLLQTPYYSWLYSRTAVTTPALLRLDPLWDPLRGDPRFEQIVASLAPKGNHSVARVAASGGNTTSAPPEKSIAVLPFENASNDPNAEYLSEGISEALINSLTELQQLRVIARSTASHYKGKDVDPQRVGRELQVAVVLTGRVRQSQDALSIQVDLVDAVTGAQLWGAGYDRKISDVIAVKQAIAREVTAKLKLKLTGDEQLLLAKGDTTNTEAYRFYLRGRYFWNKRTPDGIKQAIAEFQQAIERDPHFALGYVGLADCYTGLTFYNFAAPHEAMPKAKESAIKALSLDNTVAEAHASLAHILMNYDWDWATAEKEFKRSIELKPDYGTAHQWYAIHYLTATNRLEEAVQEMKRALELEPASLVMNTFMGATLYHAGRYDEAIDQCRRTVEMDPNFAVAHWHLGLAYEQKQVFDKAIEEFRKAITLSQGSPLMKAALGHAYAKAKKTDEANKILDELNELSKHAYVSPLEMAQIYVALGNNEKAFQFLEKAYADHSFHLVNLNVSPHFKELRSNQRFQDVVQRIGLAR